jgi:ADP-heptose:LPS heptosyltransferase
MLGDASFLSVMLDPLKERYPHAEIHLLIQEKCAVLYRNDPRVAKIHACHLPWIDRRGEGASRWSQLLRTVFVLRKEKIDMAMDVRGEIRSQILMVLAGIPKRVGFINYLCSNMVIKGRLLTDNAGELPLQHRIHTCLDLCELVGCRVDRSGWLPSATGCSPLQLKRILVHTGAGGFLRVWPVERWAALLDRIRSSCDADIRLVGSQSEVSRNRAIAGRASFDLPVLTTSLAQLMEEIEAADLVICLDSAPLHLAVLKSKPVLALFGPGPTWLYQPISPGSRIVHHQERFECAPCTQDKCVQPVESACMLAIGVDEVHEVFMEMAGR